MSLLAVVAVVVFVASVFAAGFIVVMRDVDQLRAHVDHEDVLDALWGPDDEVAA